MTTTWTTIASNSVTQSIADAAATSATAASDSASAAATSATTAAATVVSTNANVVLTAADVVSTNADVVLTNADVVLTTADAVSTAANAVSTAADLVQTDLDVTATAASASGGATSATAAATSATASAASATAAASSASGGATSATNAATSETNASTSATNAGTSATAAAASLTSFTNTYHGASATAPTGASVTTGDLWFDTSVGVDAMKVYNGSAFVAAYISASGMLTATNNLSDISSASSGRTNLGLGALAVLATVNNATWSGTDLAVANGGTGASDAATAQTNLSLVPGTNVQAYDADLAAIAGLTSAADRLAYYTGSGAASLATFSTAGRALVDDADAAAQRTTLGLGTMAVATATDYLAKAGGTMTGQVVLHSTGIQFSDATTQTTAPTGISMGKAIASAIVFG